MLRGESAHIRARMCVAAADVQTVVGRRIRSVLLGRRLLERLEYGRLLDTVEVVLQRQSGEIFGRLRVGARGRRGKLQFVAPDAFAVKTTVYSSALALK